MAKATGARGTSEPRQESVGMPAAISYLASAPRDRHLELLATAIVAALKVALDALPLPALVTDRSGKIVCSNVHARAFVGQGDDGAQRRLPANDPGGSLAGWDETPIRGAGPAAWSLLILRRPEAALPRRCHLTQRQTEVLNLVLRGLTNVGIAETLGIRLGTVEFHISAIFDKVGVSSRAALIATVMCRESPDSTSKTGAGGRT